MRARWRLGALFVVLAMLFAACGGSDEGGEDTSGSGSETTVAAAADVTIGMILVGPQDDHGWSQANYEGGQYVADQLGLDPPIVIDKVNTADRPDTTVEQVVDDLVSQGADIVFATSDDMKDGILAGAAAHPDVPMIWTSGDSAWADGESFAGLDNLGNVMGKMIYGKMIAGCAAALKTQTGKIAYLGPLINDETRRLVDSVYLGAQYCWQNMRGESSDIGFEVSWIGFWFNLPGVTLDPTQVVNDFLDNGADVVVSGIDTTEAIVRVGQRAEAGEEVWAIPYDFKGACAEAESACLGVPYFNWGPAYLDIVKSVADGTFKAEWSWVDPDWSDINSETTSSVGFVEGDGLGDAASQLDEFIAGLASGDVDLWTGPLNYQDGSAFLADGEKATDQQIWYMPQLLEGMEGASTTEG